MLVVSRDPGLRDHLLRLAAAAGAAADPCPEPGSALRSWSTAAVVLVGADVATDLASLSPARRRGVHVVAWAPVPDASYRDALDLGAHDVLELPRCDAWLTEVLTDAGEPGGHGGVRGPGTVVGVVGGSGGAGATTLAAALGQVGAARGPALVVDLDRHGPGLDRVAGLEERVGIGWDDLARTAGRLGARALREAVPRRAGLGVLTWRADGRPAAPAATTVGAVLEAARRGHDLVVVDLAREVATGDDVLTRVDRLLVVARPGLSPAASAVRLVRALAGQATPLLVVRGTPLDATRLERATGAPVLLSMGDQRGLGEAVDLGLGPVRHRRGALGRAAAEVLDLLAVRGPAGPAGAAA